MGRVVPSVQQSVNMGTWDCLRSGNPTDFSTDIWIPPSPHPQSCYLAHISATSFPSPTPHRGSDPDFPLRLQISEHSCTQAPLQQGHHAPGEEYLCTTKCTLHMPPLHSVASQKLLHIGWPHSMSRGPVPPGCTQQYLIPIPTFPGHTMPS